MVVYGSNVAIDVPVNYRSLLRSSINLKFFLIYDLVDQDRKIGLEQLSGLLRANSLHHEIGARFTLEEIASAHEAVESGQVVGNVVLTMS
jgi:NADPH2:quinone reductase